MAGVRSGVGNLGGSRRADGSRATSTESPFQGGGCGPGAGHRVQGPGWRSDGFWSSFRSWCGAQSWFGLADRSRWCARRGDPRCGPGDYPEDHDRIAGLGDNLARVTQELSDPVVEDDPGRESQEQKRGSSTLLGRLGWPDTRSRLLRTSIRNRGYGGGSCVVGRAALIPSIPLDQPQSLGSTALSDLESVRTTIEKVRGHLEDGSVRSEADVRLYILTPLLRCLGWDLEDPGTVRREYAVTGGKNYRFDYALFAEKKAVAFVIEAKALGKLDDDARDQLLLYAMKTHTRLGLTTDGRTWSFYLPLGGGSSEERLVRTVDLTATSAKEAGAVFERYLARDRVLTGVALRAATDDRERFALGRIIQAGWVKLVGGPNEKLVKVIAGAAKAATTCRGGRAPSTRTLNDAVRAFIRHGFAFPGEMPEVHREVSIQRPTASPTAVAGGRGQVVLPPKRSVAWTFRGERRVEKNSTVMYVAIIGRLYEDRGGVDFYTRLMKKLSARTRTQIAPSRAETGLQPELFKYLRPLPGGWWLNTNLSTGDKMRNLRRACDIAGVSFGSDLVIEANLSTGRKQRP